MLIRKRCQHGVPSDFACNKRWEDDVWDAQYKVGTEIEANLARALGLHRGRSLFISHVSGFPMTYPFLIAFMCLLLMPFCSQLLLHILRDKSVELDQQYSKVHWLERYNASLIDRLGEANTLVSDLGA